MIYLAECYDRNEPAEWRHVMVELSAGQKQLHVISDNPGTPSGQFTCDEWRMEEKLYFINGKEILFWNETFLAVKKKKKKLHAKSI